jgi:hypothetical protein
MPGISAYPGGLKKHQPCIDANTHEFSRLPCILGIRNAVRMVNALVVLEPACAIVSVSFCSGQSVGPAVAQFLLCTFA